MKDNYLELLARAADKMINISPGSFTEGCPISIIDVNKWEWAQGVGMYGMFKCYEQTKDEKILNFLIWWYDKRIKEGLPEKNVNTMAPMLTLAFLYETTKDEKYLPVCLEWVEWIINEMPKTEDKGLQHIVSGYENNGQLWDDTLYMTVLFLTKMGSVLKKTEYIDESVRQFLVHIKYLFDKKTGLWFHGWNFNGRHNFGEALWGRGNSWFTAGLVDYLDISKIGGGVKQYLIDTLAAQVKALEKYQHEDGMWSTLIDQTDTYKECSATAGFAYGILKAVRMGYIDDRYKEMGQKALEAVIRNISQDGTVENVSYGTGVGDDFRYYKDIKICPMTYGQALAILALTEGMKM